MRGFGFVCLDRGLEPAAELDPGGAGVVEVLPAVANVGEGPLLIFF